MNDRAQDETMKERIIGLLRKHYSRSQLIADFGFAERTVDAAIKTYRELNDERAEGAKDNAKSVEEDGASLPTKSKNMAKGATESPRDGALAIRKEKESVLPEWLERDVAVIFDGQVRDQRIFLAGMSVPLMGLRLFSEAVNPIVDLLTVWQKGQVEAARVAQGSGIEMANAAGQAAAAGVAKFLMEEKPWVAAAPDPWKAMVVDSMRPVFAQVIGQVMGGLMRFTPQGQAGMQPPSTAQPGFQSQQSGQPTFQQSSNVRQATDEEIKEAFNDE